MQPQEVLDNFLKIAAAYDEPYENSSVFPAHHCARIAREHGAQYMFAGDGGDEIFAGNKRYAEQQIFRDYFKIPGPVRRFVLEPLLLNRLEKIPLALFRKGGSYIRRANLKEVERIVETIWKKESVHGVTQPQYSSAAISILCPGGTAVFHEADQIIEGYRNQEKIQRHPQPGLAN
jgi:asparagine synthase (glutamine-hydrolysing)